MGHPSIGLHVARARWRTVAAGSDASRGPPAGCATVPAEEVVPVPMPSRPWSVFGVPYVLVAVGCSTAAYGNCTCGERGPSAHGEVVTVSGWLSNLTLSGRCVTVSSSQASPPDKSPVVLAPCDNSPQQAAGFDGNAVLLEGKCLDLPGSQTAPGTSLQLFSCNRGSNQQFTWDSDGTLRVLGMCVAAAGRQVVIQSCTGAPDQRVTRVPLPLP
jgi:Ricin-type beta-trefoil lectin domain